MSRVTCKAFGWAVALPVLWILLFYTFVAHVRLALGRWPVFNERLAWWPFEVYDQVIRFSAVALFYSLPVAGVICIVGLIARRWHFSLYALAYGTAVGAALGTMYLAPHGFLNWWFD